MKLLLAISSWPHADHSAHRETFLQVVAMSRRRWMDCYFFIGDGTPIHENEEELEAAWQEGLQRLPHYSNKLAESHLISHGNCPDEVWVPAPYDFKHLPLKVREIFRWAYACDYTHVFKCDTDTYVDIPRLLACGWEQHDYMGHPFWQDGIPVASGGAGYFVSRKAFGILKDTPVTIPFEDSWVGRTMHQHGIRCQSDSRFRVNSPHEFSSGPRPDNDAITSHLGFSPEPYDPRDMYLAHRLRYS